MELVKPEPLIIGGRAHYTLTSYDPVSIEVDVASTLDADVELALRMSVTQMGGGPAELANDAWIRQNFEGLHNATELREYIRQELQAMNGQAAEQQKAQKCAEALAKRLVQAVPQAEVAQAERMMAESFALELQEQGISQAQFLAQSGLRASDLELMFAEQAKDAAEQQAAIDAWIEHRKLQVSDDELPFFVGMPQDHDPKALVSELRMSGQLEAARQLALRNKAIGIVVAEASCTYRHETPAEAQARNAQLRQALDAQTRSEQDRASKPNAHPHLKLV